MGTAVECSSGGNPKDLPPPRRSPRTIATPLIGKNRRRTCMFVVVFFIHDLRVSRVLRAKLLLAKGSVRCRTCSRCLARELGYRSAVEEHRGYEVRMALMEQSGGGRIQGLRGRLLAVSVHTDQSCAYATRRGERALRSLGALEEGRVVVVRSRLQRPTAGRFFGCCRRRHPRSPSFLLATRRPSSPWLPRAV